MLTKEIIIKNEQDLLEALKSCSITKLEDLLHDELLFIIPNGQTITKAIDLEAYRTGNMTVISIKPSDELISIIDDDAAIVSVKIELVGKYYDQEINGIFQYLRVWKMVDDKCKVIAGSCVQLSD